MYMHLSYEYIRKLANKTSVRGDIPVRIQSSRGVVNSWTSQFTEMFY